MIDICRKELYPNVHVPVQGWALLEAAGYRYVAIALSLIYIPPG